VWTKVLVYKVDNPVQSSLSSSLVLTQYKILLYGRFLLIESSLSSNYIISSILSSNRSYNYNSHNISIDNLTFKQRLYLRSSLIDIDNRYNELLFSFSFFNEELNLEN